MEQGGQFERLTDWLVVVVMAVVLCVLYGGWLASYRTPKAAPVGASVWFRLPAWAQIAAGLITSVIGAYGCYLLWIPMPIALSPGVALALRIGGLGVVVIGAALFLWARRALGLLYNASTSTAVQLHAEHRLIQHGPFAIVRHPMYLSYWLMLFGLLVMYHTWTALVTLVMMVTALTRRARREDQVLEATFGHVWRGYAGRVRFRFVPTIG